MYENIISLYIATNLLFWGFACDLGSFKFFKNIFHVTKMEIYLYSIAIISKRKTQFYFSMVLLKILVHKLQFLNSIKTLTKIVVITVVSKIFSVIRY